jgi:Uma2 family endonuclease
MTTATAPVPIPSTAAARDDVPVAAPQDTPSPPQPFEPRPRNWTTGEFMKMIELGLVSGRVDLVDGKVVEMPAAMGDRHAISRERVTRWLHRSFPEPYFVRSQETHRFTADLTREPDAALLTRDPRPDEPVHELPPLVIEVSDDSLHYDLTVKRLEYARAGVPDYWVVDIPHRRVRVFREPDPTATDPERAYRVDLIFEGDAAITTLCQPAAITTPNAVLPPAGF